jgi:Rrf2 family transcriptional regulator, nitric oxide-sensitive transcriptional repressor
LASQGPRPDRLCITPSRRARNPLLFAQTTEYALRAVVCLAQNADRPLTTQQIADMTKVPPGYLSKVLQSLGRAGIVQSQRGVHGGFALSVPATKLTILRVVNVVDPIRRIRTCPLNLESHGTHLCQLHRRMDEAMASIEKAFGQTTISELLASPNRSTPLCEVNEKSVRGG